MHLSQCLCSYSTTLSILICVGVKAFLPHRMQVDHMVAVSQILLCDLHLGHHIGVLHLSKERAERFTGLEINRTVLDLDYHVVTELSVQGFELLDCLLCAVL